MEGIRIYLLVLYCFYMKDSPHSDTVLQGWKLPDLMFATRRSLSEARSTIAKQLENVYSSIGVTLYTLVACIYVALII